MKKNKLILLISIIILLLVTSIIITLYFTIWQQKSTGSSQKIDLSTVITTTEINGNEANDETSVFNKILELHSESNVTEQDIQIKENSFNPANGEETGTAIIAAKSISNYTGEVDITITPLNEKIDLNKESLTYLAKVEYMNLITTDEANTIKNDLQTNITNKMNNLSLEKNIDYQITNLDNIKNGDNLNDFLNTIRINSLDSSTKATGSFTVTLSVQENINNRTIEAIEIEASQADGLSAEIAKSVTNNILIKTATILNKGQINQINIDYEIINLEMIAEGAKFSDYYNQIKVKGISERLLGEFSIILELEK